MFQVKIIAGSQRIAWEILNWDKHVSSEDKVIILSLLWLSCCTGLLVTTIWKDFSSMFLASKVMSIIECREEKKPTERKKFQVAFCASLFIQKCFGQPWIFSTFLLSITDQFFIPYFLRKVRGQGGKEIWFILIYRLQFFLPIFSISIPLFSRSEKVHFKTLSKYPEHYSLYKTQFDKNS